MMVRVTTQWGAIEKSPILCYKNKHFYSAQKVILYLEAPIIYP